jgi:hypothetical protein
MTVCSLRTLRLVLPIALLMTGGCGPNLGLVPVTGRVTFAGKSPPAECSLIFAPADAASKLRPGVAICDSSGYFRAGSYKLGDGLLPGRYRPRLRCIDFANATETKPPVDHVPEGFELPVFEVPSQGVEIDFDVR